MNNFEVVKLLPTKYYTKGADAMVSAPFLYF